MGTGACTAGGSDGSDGSTVVVCGGAGMTGWVIEGGRDVGVSNLGGGVDELPLCGEDPEVELEEDHGSRRRLADLGRC